MHATAIRPAAGDRRQQRRRSRPVSILIVTVLAGLGLGRFALAGSDTAAQAPAGEPVAAAPVETAAAAVARVQAQLRKDPGNPQLLTRLGLAQLGRAKETADPTAYAAAEAALRRAARIAHGDKDTLTGLGVLALARHDFRGALVLGERARAAAPDATAPLAVIGDAQVELGRYGQAAATIQAMADRRPDLSSLSRASYLRELRGDRQGALTAMTQAATAGSAAPADRAYISSLLGDLRLAGGELEQARTGYLRAVADVPGYAPAEVGLARVEAASGDLAGAVARLRPVVERRPEPASVALLGDIDAALGRAGDAATQYALVRAIERLNRANGVAVDLELARFEADHARDADGDKAGAVRLATVAAKARPTIYADDTLGWALRQAGRPQAALAHARAAVRLGTRDALLWYHLAAVEADLGRPGPARAHLGHALTINPYLTVRDLPAARRLAARLGLASASPVASPTAAGAVR